MKTFTSANLKTAFTYMFKGEGWQNRLLITGALMLLSFIIPIVPLLAILGYLIKLVKNVIEGDGQPSLPEWDNGRDLIRTGLKLLGLLIVLSLPLIILWIIPYGIVISPLILLYMDHIISDSLEMLTTLLAVLAAYVSLGLSFVVIFLQSISICHATSIGQFSAAFRFREWWSILRANIGDFLRVFVIMFGLYFGTNILSAGLFFLLPLGRAYTILVLAPLIGQSYRSGVKKLEEAEAKT